MRKPFVPMEIACTYQCDSNGCDEEAVSTVSLPPKGWVEEKPNTHFCPRCVVKLATSMKEKTTLSILGK